METRHHVGGIDAGQLALMKDVADASAEKVAANMFKAMGLDTSNPIEAQDTFAALRRIAKRMDDPEAVADLAWTRRMRPRTEGMFGKALLTAVAIAVAGGIHMIVTGAAAMIGVQLTQK